MPTERRKSQLGGLLQIPWVLKGSSGRLSPAQGWPNLLQLRLHSSQDEADPSGCSKSHGYVCVCTGEVQAERGSPPRAGDKHRQAGSCLLAKEGVLPCRCEFPPQHER